MKQKQKKSLIKTALQFIKLQIAGNVLFWGTLLGTALFAEVIGWPDLWSLATASLIAHGLFFVIDKEWVFADKKGKRKTNREITRFILFMGFNFLLNISIIQTLIALTPLNVYASQFVAATFFTFWNFAGLKFWVFQMPEHHAITVHKVGHKHHVRRTT